MFFHGFFDLFESVDFFPWDERCREVKYQGAYDAPPHVPYQGAFDAPPRPPPLFLYMMPLILACGALLGGLHPQTPGRLKYRA